MTVYGAKCASWRAHALVLVHRLCGPEGRVTVRRPLVSVVDDDESARESLPDLIRELGYAARAFASAQEFLASGGIVDTECLILDVAMPGMSGPELQQQLTREGHAIPIIFITAMTDKSIAAALLQRGAVACLLKPFGDQDLRSALATALPGT
ncbi:MAG: response regulator [Sinobacteraceae bacterium]|nr:response regulator [Nevskiaceae bacterium]